MTHEPLPNRSEGLPEERYYSGEEGDQWSDELHDVLREISNNAIVSGENRGDFNPERGTLYVPTTPEEPLSIGTGSEWIELGALVDPDVLAAKLDSSGGTITGSLDIDGALDVADTITAGDNLPLGASYSSDVTSTSQNSDLATSGTTINKYAFGYSAAVGDIASVRAINYNTTGTGWYANPDRFLAGMSITTHNGANGPVNAVDVMPDGSTYVKGNEVYHEGNLPASSGGGGGGYSAHIDDYGADPTGATASDAALDSMIAAASAGDVLSLEHGTYKFDQYHDCPIPVIFDGTGGEIIASAYNGDKSTLDQNAMFDTEEAVISFAGTQSGTSTTTAVSQRKTDDRITVSSTTGFSVGDDILIRQSGGAILSRVYQPTRTRIREIDGSDLYLTTSLKYSYDSGSEVVKLDPVVGGEFRNINFSGGDPGNCLSSRYSRNVVYRDCTVDGYLQHALQTWDDLQTKIIDCKVTNPLSRAASHGESIRVCGSSDITVTRPIVKDARRGIDIRSGCKTLRIYDPDVTNCSLFGISYHNDSTADVYGSIEVHGGQVTSRSTDDPTLNAGEAHTGYGVNTSTNTSMLKLVDVTFEARRNALAGNGHNVVADGCTFRSTYQTSTLYPTVVCGGNNIRLSDCTIETYGARGTGLSVTGDDIDIENLRINPGQTVHGQWTQHPIRVDGAGEVSIDVQNVDWADGAIPAVSIGAVDSLSLSGDIAGPTGTQVTSITADGAVSNLMLDDIRSSPKIDISGATSLGELWVGKVECPTFTYGTASTLRDAYGVA